MKLSYRNIQLQKLLHEAYERFIRLPGYSKPANFNIQPGLCSKALFTKPVIMPYSNLFISIAKK